MVKTQERSTALSTVTKRQIKYRNGLNLNESQAEGTPTGLKHEIIIVPSTNTPSYGSMFILDLREMNILLHNITLQFNISAISGTSTPSSPNPNFTPAFWLFTRIEILQSGNVIDTIYPTSTFILNQFLNDENDRAYVNNMAGNYASGAQRFNMAATTSNYFVNLRTYFDQCHLPILKNSDQVQLRVYMDTLSNQVIKGALTGTPAATLNFCNAICKITRLSSQIATEKLNALTKSPSHSFFHDLRYGLFSVLSGVSSTQLVLTPIVGKVAVLFFVVRPTANLNGSAYYTFNAIRDFAILNSASTNIVGGQVIPSALALQYLNLYWSASAYSNETALGTVDNSANIYCWSFSSDPINALSKGLLLGNHQFTGAEQLQINFTSSLAAGVNVDVFAFSEAMIEQAQNYVKKISL